MLNGGESSRKNRRLSSSSSATKTVKQQQENTAATVTPAQQRKSILTKTPNGVRSAKKVVFNELLVMTDDDGMVTDLFGLFKNNTFFCLLQILRPLLSDALGPIAM